MKLVIDLGREWEFDSLEEGTIALDGAVQGPRLEPATRRYSFDHHAGCIRLVTSATCCQVHDAILLGLDPSDMTVLVNDLDGDTVLSIWLLEHPQRWRDQASAVRAQALTSTVGAADAHGPAYRLAAPGLYAHWVALVADPVHQAKLACFPLGPHAALRSALDALERWWQSGLRVESSARPALAPLRLTAYPTWVLGEAESAEPAIRYEGALELYARGHDRLVLSRPGAAGRRHYTLAKRSDLVSGFPLDRLYAALNDAEASARGVKLLSSGETWGGGSSIGGSPRKEGSVLAGQDVADTIQRVLRE